MNISYIKFIKCDPNESQFYTDISVFYHLNTFLSIKVEFVSAPLIMNAVKESVLLL